jgi:hypothetical protein
LKENKKTVKDDVVLRYVGQEAMHPTEKLKLPRAESVSELQPNQRSH